MSESERRRWRRIEALLDEALRRPPEERRAWLRRACEDAPALWEEVEAYLAHAERADGFLDRPARDHLRTLLEAEEKAEPLPASNWEGRRVGPYRVLREAGRGGMGIVLLAERADGQFEQRVALKVVKRGLDTDEILERFRRERQILARLEHPGIARLLDGGVTGEGQPFFAMEYVEGEPITAYCDRGRLRIGDRLQLFARACDGVQYAHRNLVVHRDLKPSNILVTATGEPKLVDFGIAKLLGDDPAVTAATVTGGRPLTPAYAAPEQLTGDPVTTATDVYALGVVLYELLSGRRPYTAAPGEDLERAILASAPPFPSVAAVRAAPPGTPDEQRPSPEEVAAARRLSPAALSRRLAGDLDAIILTALRREPERRYASASELRADVGRHLHHRPILARAEGAVYRAGKFVRRHRLGVAATGLVLAALAAGLAGTAWQARVAAREARKAQEVQEFVLGLFEASDPAEALGREVTARDLLDRGAVRVRQELAGQPEVQSELLGVLGELYRRLGVYDRAETLLGEALEGARQHHGRDSREAVTLLERWGVLLWDRGDYQGAERTLRQVLARREARPGPADPQLAETLTALANVLTDEGRYQEAEGLHRRALALDRARFGEASAVAASALADLATVLWHQGRYEEAEPMHREALRLRRQVLGDLHPDTASSLHALATLLSSKGDYQEADALFREAIERRKEIFGPEHPEVTYSLDNYGILLQRRGELEAAKPVLLEALEIRRKTLGPEHPDLATSLNNYGVLCYRLSDFGEAESVFREAMAIWERELGHQHPSVASVINNIGMIRLERGDPVGAEPLVREGLALRRELLGPRHQAVAQSLRNLGLVLLERGEVEEAGQVLGEGLDLAREVYPVGHPRIAEALVGLGQVRLEEGRFREAEPLLREALAVRRENLGTGDWRTAEAELFLGLCRAAAGDLEEARELLAHSREVLGEQRGEDHRLTRRAVSALAAL